MYTDDDLLAIVRYLQQLPLEVALHEIEYTYKPVGVSVEYKFVPFATGARLHLTAIWDKRRDCVAGHTAVTTAYASGYHATVCTVCGRVLATEERIPV